jgi:hypothetical protein
MGMDTKFQEHPKKQLLHLFSDMNVNFEISSDSFSIKKKCRNKGMDI